MAITNYGELKAAVADYTKRRDLTAQIPDFIYQTHVKLIEAAGNLTQLVNDSDTNQLLTYQPMAYLFGALAEAYLYLRDLEMMNSYLAKFEAELSNLYMTGFDTIDGVPSGQVQ